MPNRKPVNMCPFRKTIRPAPLLSSKASGGSILRREPEPPCVIRSRLAGRARLGRAKPSFKANSSRPRGRRPGSCCGDHPNLSRVIPGGSPRNPMGAAAITLKSFRSRDPRHHREHAQIRRHGRVYGCIRIIMRTSWTFIIASRLGRRSSNSDKTPLFRSRNGLTDFAGIFCARAGLQRALYNRAAWRDCRRTPGSARVARARSIRCGSLPASRRVCLLVICKELSVEEGPRSCRARQPDHRRDRQGRNG